jgi:hypothetical protein
VSLWTIWRYSYQLWLLIACTITWEGFQQLSELFFLIITD